MTTNNIPRHMIVQSKAVDNSHRACILLTNKTIEELSAGPMPPELVPECTTLPLVKNLDELWRERGNYNAHMDLACRDAEVTILSGQRKDCDGYKYVGLVHSHDGDDKVECWNRDGEPESGDPDHKLGSYPEERFGHIAIYKGCVTNKVCESESAAIQELKLQMGLNRDAELDPKDVFLVQIRCWVTDDGTVRVI